MKIAINGFGRIGRIFFRQAFGAPEIEIVAINDLGSGESLAYLLKYDTVYGKYDKDVSFQNGNLIVAGKSIKVFQEKDPAKLPWGELGIDVVVESTGVFETTEKAKAHLDAGAKRVVLTAAGKDESMPIATPNVHMENLQKGKITSNASCTTNAVNPVVAILNQSIGIKKALLNTVHAYTATQNLVDGPDKSSTGSDQGKGDFRRGRAAGQNIVPSTTNAAKATTRVITELEGKFDGVAIRIPIVSGSLIDLTFIASRPTTVEEINNIFKNAAANLGWKDIIEVTEEPLVSSDILGNPHGAIVDLSLTKVVDGDLVKVFAWYDNEWGYCAMLLKHVLEASKYL
ncbi:MAG: glyceraldehyde 3-phosphate dehydrogenase [Parcubacteria group bacterium Licking1014_17]|nr:MAG: glyceraldehyde 3-phosphate dehydrogenase [Parcubacteria group bacterium Licking1014_17]